MQLVAGGHRPDSLADGRADGAGNSHDDLARRQFAGGGGDALNFLLSGAVNKSFGADAFDRFHGEAERHAAGNRFVRDDEILRANAEMPASLILISPASCDLISSERSGIRFIGGAPMKEATKVVAGFW